MIRVHTSVNFVWSFTFIKRCSIIIMYICGNKHIQQCKHVTDSPIFFSLVVSHHKKQKITQRLWKWK